MRNALFGVTAGLVLVGTLWFFLGANTSPLDSPLATTTPVSISTETNRDAQGAAIGEENFVTFSCPDGMSIAAVFERDIVGLTLSDGRHMTLRQAVSGSGIRYLSNDTKIQFTGKDNEATLRENEKTTYANCVASR